MSKCTQCPHAVGDSYQRDCAFPDCMGGWDEVYKDLANQFAELQARNVELNKKLLANTLRELAGIPVLEAKITELQGVVDRLAGNKSLSNKTQSNGMHDMNAEVLARIEYARQHATPEGE